MLYCLGELVHEPDCTTRVSGPALNHWPIFWTEA